MKTPKNLAEATVEEKRQFIASFDTVLLDCDGVLWSILSTPIERAEEGVKALQVAGKELFFLSNNATRTTPELKEKFAKYDINLDLMKQFHTPANSFVDYLNSINFDQSIYLIGSAQLADHLRRNDFQVIVGPNHVEEGGYQKELMTVAPNVGAVVLDTDVNLNLIKIHKAEMQLLRNPKCLLIFGATEDEYDLGKGVILSAAGKFQKILQDKHSRKPIVLGKPGAQLGELIAAKFKGKRVLFVGDNLETDIRFANQLGFQSLLVFSGCCKKEEFLKEEKLTVELPDYYLDSVGQLAGVLKGI